jgi:hypothetical protein
MSHSAPFVGLLPVAPLTFTFHAEFLLAHCLEQYLDVGDLVLLHAWKAHFTTGEGGSSMCSLMEAGS